MDVTYIDHSGTDLTVANAARVSFSKESTWEIVGYEESADLDSRSLSYYPVERLRDSDGRLISYLARHKHWTPFGHPSITLRERVPVFVARQRFKHVVGFVYNEVSRRYVDDTPEFYTPEVWRARAENKKQGSSDEPLSQTLRVKMGGEQTITGAYERLMEHATDLYEEMIEHGVAPEQARMVLPQSMFTEFYVSGSLAAFARAYNLRSAEDAQLEIQELSTYWDRIIRPLFPVSWAALVDKDTN